MSPRLRELRGSDAGQAARGPVIYWMQAAMRVECNDALESAVALANQRGVELWVIFVLTDRFLNAPLRHYWFLYQGLIAVAERLRRRGIPFAVHRGDPPQVIATLTRVCAATAIVMDRGYLRLQREWYQAVQANTTCALYQAETNVVVPIEEVSNKDEYAAATIRKKVTRRIAEFLMAPPVVAYHLAGREPAAAVAALLNPPEAQTLLQFTTPAELARELQLSTTVGPSARFQGGREAAESALESFLSQRLAGYNLQRNDPVAAHTSHLSAYLHFGQLSPVEIALRAQRYVAEAQTADPAASLALQESLDAFLEEMIVRRELAANFVFFNPQYDSFDCLPAWAQKTLDNHRGDPRPYSYSFAQLDQAQTHDSYWNAAQREMVETGKMHGYMRMYWGKKILEWCTDPREAFAIALRLNDTYQLDGRDPNGYAGVAWCFGKHDRPWFERAIFGTVRYMNDKGLERKFRIKEYAARYAPPAAQPSLF